MWPILSFFLGLLLGHWLSLGRDRRKEFNAAADVLYPQLEAERKNPSPFKHPSESDFTAFRRHLPSRRRSAFDDAVAAYKKAQGENQTRGASGSVSYRDTTAIVTAVEVLLKFTERK